MVFELQFLNVCKDVSDSSFFSHTARLWNSLTAVCFPWPIIYIALTLFKMDLFRAAHRWGEGEKAPSINSVTHPTMMKLGTVIPHLAKNIQKRYKSCDIHLDISIFSLEISNLCYIKKHRCRLHFNNIISNSFDFF